MKHHWGYYRANINPSWIKSKVTLGRNRMAFVKIIYQYQSDCIKELGQQFVYNLTTENESKQ